MKRWLIAGVVLLGGTVLSVQADYVVIEVNLAATKDKDQAKQGPGGLPGMMPGMQGGGAGFRGGMPGAMQGGAGLRGGGAGGAGLRGGVAGPGAGARGKFGAGQGEGGIPPAPGVGPMMPGAPGAGARGGMPAGIQGGPMMPGGSGAGFRGGTPAGMQGGAMMMQGGGRGSMMPGAGGGMQGGFAGGRMGGFFTSQPEDDEPESNPLLIEAIIEVKHSEIGRSDTGRKTIKHQWGKTFLYEDPQRQEVKVTIIPLPTVQERFKDQQKAIKDSDPDKVDKLLDLAKWALSHGLHKEAEYVEVTEVMDRLASLEPKHPSVTAFQTVKTDLGRPIDRDDPAVTWVREKLGDYKIRTSKHYTLVYDVRSEADATRRLEILEQNYRGFFYWFALRGKALPVPDHRLVALLVDTKDNFERQHKEVFDDVPMLADGFYARRENLAVFSNKRLDESFEGMEKTVKPMWDSKDWFWSDLLQGKGQKKDLAPGELARAQTYTLVWKAMQKEAELASVTHEGTRQLIAALPRAGQISLPRSVEAPRWIDFGMASFFDTPKGSFWSGTGAPNLPYQINYQLWDESKKLDKPADALKSVVTDRYFREVNKSQSKERALTKARTMTWALTYFLAQEKRDGLLEYYRQLSNLPRDMEFDEDTLLLCFARAFDLLDRSKPREEIDQTKLANLANLWHQSMRLVQPEVKEALKEARAEYQKKIKGSKTGAGASPTAGSAPGNRRYPGGKNP